jgi:L-ascorbate metabolism protein UlaG (beta-lactamase superfamily)
MSIARIVCPSPILRAVKNQDSLPHVDVVLIRHDHYKRLDIPSLLQLGTSVPKGTRHERPSLPCG